MQTASFNRIALSISLVGLVTIATSCQQEDTGRCCDVLLSDASTAIPNAEFPGDGGIPRNLVAQHPAFDCESLTCVSWQGSTAFCSRRCSAGKPCPQGFNCKPVIESDPGAGASIQPGDTFCVRQNCDTDVDCPEGFTCRPAFTDREDITADKQCVQTDFECNSTK
ncbi:MAG: hypothetical protein VYC39_13855 [Myxococcota bacterium]|nr:hypothetical protein [Myxococcota bacterium]